MKDAPTGLPVLVLRIGLTLALLPLALVTPGSPMFWGFSAGAGWPAAFRVALAGFGLLGVWWPWRAEPGTAFNRTLVILGAALVLLWSFLPCRTLLFGDSADIVGRLGGAEGLAPRSPLYNLIGFTLVRLRPDVNREALMGPVQAVSVVCGILYLVILAFMARGSARRLHPAALALLAGGYLSLFQGYIESYPLVLVILAGWTAAVLAPAGRARNISVILLTAAGMASHGMGLLLLPCGLLAIRPIERKDLRRLIPVGIAFVLVLALLVIARKALPPWLRNVDPVLVAENFGRVTLLMPRPWSAGLLSLDHLMDIVNGLRLGFGPLLFVIPALLVFGGGRLALLRAFRTPVGLLAILMIGARWFTATSLGALLDWDLMCLFFWPLAIVIGLAWSDAGAAPLRRLAPAVLITGIVLTVPWAAQLSSDEASVRYITAYRDGSPAIRPYLAAHVDHRLGDRLVRLGRQGEAAALFSRAGERYPRDVYARRAATAWLSAGDRERSKAEYARAVTLNPHDLVSRRQLGFFLMEDDRAAEAAEQFNAVLAEEPKDGRAHFGLGLLAAQRGDRNAERDHLTKALPGLRKNLTMDPGSRTEQMNLAETLNRLGRPDEALGVLEALLEEKPGDLRILYNLGVAYTSLGRYREARDVFRFGLSLSSGDFKFLANLGQVDLVLENWAEADSAYSAALAIRDVPVIRLDRARALINLGATDRARADVEWFLARSPGDSAGLALLKEITAAGGR